MLRTKSASTPWSIVVTAGLSDYKLASKLHGLAMSEHVAKIILIRRTPLAGLDKVININPPAGVSALTPIYEVWRAVTLRKILRQQKPDVVLGIQLLGHGLQALLATRGTEIPCINCAIGKDIHDFATRRFLGAPLRWALRESNGIVIMGSRSRHLAVFAGASPSRVVEIQNFQPEARFRRPPSGSKTQWDFVTVGALIRRKRIDLLLQAMTEVVRYYPHTTLAIIGDGPQREKLERTVRHSSLEANVHFLGHSNQVELHLQRARCFVLSSQMEALPAAAIEAMYCGVPTILPNICDIPGYFNDSNSLLFPPGDAQALAAQMSRFLASAHLRAKLAKGIEATRADFVSRWSEKAIRDAWHELLERTIKPRSPRRTRN